MKKLFGLVLAGCMTMALLAVGASAATTYTSGDWSYTISGTNASITAYSGSGGQVTVPATFTQDGTTYTVTEIRHGVMANNTTITAVTMPAGINLQSNYDTGVFEGDTKLKTVTFTESSLTGDIGDSAFNGCSSLGTIDIPENYTQIHRYAFNNCTSLRTVTIAEGCQGIDAGAFQNCTALSAAEVPSTVTYISTDAFRGDEALRTLTLSEGLETIEHGAFADCIALSSVTIPSTVTAITSNYDTGAFEGCTRLATVTLVPGTADSYIGDSTFNGCSSLTEISIPGNYTQVHRYAFNECTALKTVTIAEGCQGIDECAFLNCTALNTVTLPSTVTGIGADAFKGDKALKNLTLSEGLVTIEHGAFAECISLTEVTIPSTVTALTSNYDTGVFQGDTALTTVTFAVGGSEDAYIGDNAFNGCTSLKEITIPGNFATIHRYAFSDCSALTSFIWGQSDYGYANQSMDECAFQNCTSLETVVLPSTVSYIGSNAFNGDEALKNLTLSEGLETIEHGAFAGCTALEEVTIPSTVTALTSNYDTGVFQGDTALTTVTFTEGGYYDAYIGDNAFNGCTSLEEVTIPGNYTAIHRYAFNGCTSLQSVTLEEGTYSYANQEIHEHAFDGCGHLRTVSLPDTVTSIGSYAFRDNVALESVTLQEGLTTIGEGAFMGCTVLAKVDVPSTVTSMAGNYNDGIFENCTNLQYAIIRQGDYDKTLGSDAFNGCTSLKAVVLPDNIDTIYRRTFSNNGALTDVYFIGTADEWAAMDINDDSNGALETATIHYLNSNAEIPDIQVVSHKHSPVTDPGVSATCTKDGKTEGTHCSVCGQIIVEQEVIPATGHQYQLSVVPPKVGTEGYTVHTCTVCGYSYADNYTDPLPSYKVAEQFEDVEQNKWSTPYLEQAYELGFISGTTATTLEPESITTRAQFVQMLYALEGKPKVAFNNSFTDVQSGAWYASAVSWAVSCGVTAGVGDGRFAPNDLVTREQVATFLYAYMGKPAVSGSLTGYADVSRVGWSYNALLWATQNGVMAGSQENGKLWLQPDTTATRAVVATMLVGFYNKVYLPLMQEQGDIIQ